MTHVAGELWIAAERLPQFQALWPEAQLDPPIAAPEAMPTRGWSREEALVEILRGRLEGLGPVDARPRWRRRSGSRRTTSRPRSLRSRPKASPCAGASPRRQRAEEWCERRLLARIHRYTVRRLRAEIEPVAARDFLRFLLGWQRVTPETRMEGPDALEVAGRASSKGSRRRPAPGRPRSCRRGSPDTSPPGSTISAWPGASPGRA